MTFADDKTHQIPTAVQAGERLSMRLRNEDLLRLVKEGSVAAEEAFPGSVDKTDLADKLRPARFQIETGGRSAC